MTKIKGISQASQRVKSRKPQSKTPVYNNFFEVRMDGEDELDKLWDSGEIKTLYPVAPSTPSEPEPDPYLGLTEMERMEAIYGYKPAIALASEQGKISRGLVQPTSKGPKHLESNILQLRKKFGVI